MTPKQISNEEKVNAVREFFYWMYETSNTQPRYNTVWDVFDDFGEDAAIEVWEQHLKEQK